MTQGPQEAGARAGGRAGPGVPHWSAWCQAPTACAWVRRRGGLARTARQARGVCGYHRRRHPALGDPPGDVPGRSGVLVRCAGEGLSCLTWGPAELCAYFLASLPRPRRVPQAPASGLPSHL